MKLSATVQRREKPAWQWTRLLFVAVALCSLITIGAFPDQAFAAFSKRTSAPPTSNTYYYSSSYNPYYSSFTGQCTWYAQGRASEILGKKYTQKAYGAAGSWWSNASGFTKSSTTPKVGAIACSSTHVAVVEDVGNDGSITVSEYWGSSDKSFHYKQYASGPAWAKYNGGNNASFQGYIYLINDSHTHNYSKLISTSYAYGQGSGNRHGVTKTYQCSSCNSKTTKTTWENCSYSNGKCNKCGITKTVAYTFKPITIEEGVYSIRSAKNTGYTIDITGGSTNDGANAQLYKYDGAGAQLFSFVHNADDNTYSIINVKSGKALETQGWNKNSGGNIDQSGWIVGHANKRWYIGQLNDGTYILKNKHSGLFVECKGGTIANGTNIQQYTGNFENNNFKNAQKWVLTKSNVMDTSIVQLGANDRIISTFWTRQDKYNDGFQIRYATKKDMSNAKVVTDPYTSSLGKSVSGFKPGTTYYVQVRTYKHPAGSDGWFHSAWSPIQTVKTTKAKDTSNQVIVPSAQPSQGNTSNNTAKPVKVTTKSTSITKLTKGKKSFTVKWKAQKKYATGYQVQWSTDKKFKKGVKSKFVKGAKKTSLKVTKLKAKKKYYVKVRTYKQVGKTKYYSSWSKVKTVKTKK